ncbi:MAG: alpha/beta hydrolase [Planctomycetia bacterium]|nr:alpha/beta hydrolase [Planctomycetia bacterium]
MMKIVWRTLRTALIVYLGLILVLLLLENYLIYRPSRFDRGGWNPPTPNSEHVAFTSADGTELTGWYMPHPKPRGVVLFACGNGGNMSYWADTFHTLHDELQLTVLGFDYRGYGRSAGSPSEAGVLADARAARAWLAAREGIAADRVILMGRSLGGGVATDLAQDGCRALIIESSFTSLPDVAARIYPFLPVRWVMRSRYDSLSKIRNYRGPLFISHGNADGLVPFEMGRQLYDTAPGTLKRFFTVERGDHNDPQPAAYYRELSRFIEELP